MRLIIVKQESKDEKVPRELKKNENFETCYLKDLY